MISIDRAREILAADGVELSEERLELLLEDLYAVGRVIVSGYRDRAQKSRNAAVSGFSAQIEEG